MMGLLKRVILCIITNKIESSMSEPLEGTLARKEVTQNSKKHIFKSWKAFQEFTGGYFCLFPFFYTFYLFFFTSDTLESSSLNILYRLYATAVFFAITIYVIGIIIYGLYLIDFLPILVLIIPLPLLFGIEHLLNEDFGILEFFLGNWMNSTTMRLFFILGVMILSVTMFFLCYCEAKDKAKKQENTSQRKK